MNNLQNAESCVQRFKHAHIYFKRALTGIAAMPKQEQEMPSVKW